MTHDDLSASVRTTIQALLNRRGRFGKEVAAATALVGDLELDSLDLIEIGVDLEDAFDIELADDEVARLRMVGDLVEHIAGKLGVVEVVA